MIKNEEDAEPTSKPTILDGPSKKPKATVASRMKGKRKVALPKVEPEDVEMEEGATSVPASETEPEPAEEEDPDEGEDEIDEEDAVASQKSVYSTYLASQITNVTSNLVLRMHWPKLKLSMFRVGKKATRKFLMILNQYSLTHICLVLHTLL